MSDNQSALIRQRMSNLVSCTRHRSGIARARRGGNVAGSHRLKCAATLAILCVVAAMSSSGQAIEDAPASSAPDLTSPRATVTSFLEAMNAYRAGKAARLNDALGCLYLGDSGGRVQPGEATDFALRLYEIIAHFTLDLEAIPDGGDGKDVEFTLREDGEEKRAVTLCLHRYDDGAWRFPSRTIAEVPELYAQLVAGEEEVGAADNAGPLYSPRGAVRTFIEGMNRWDEGGKEEALSTLDLSAVREQVRESEGVILAELLKQILDRDHLIIYEAIPDDSEAERYVMKLRHARESIVLVPVEGEDGAREWKFSASTLDALRGIYEHYKDRPVVVGVPGAEPRTFSLRARNWVGKRYPILLSETIYLENWQWLGLFTVILLGMALSRLVAFVLALLIRKRFQSEAMSLDVRLERDFIRPIRIALMAWVWYLGLMFLGLPANTLFFLRSAAQAITAAGGVWAVYRLVDILGSFLAERAARTDNRFDDILVPLVTRSLKIFVVAVGIVFVAENLGFDYKTLFAGLGLGGLAFALAAKDTVSNIFGSLTILLDRPFQIGDWVIIGDAEGSVETVGIRSTRIRTFYNSLVAVPNSQLINATIDNMGARRYRRISMKIAITYDTPPEKIEAFCEGIRHLIRIHPYTRKDYYHVWLNEFANSSLNVLLYCFHEAPEWATELRERHRLFLDIIRLANRLGVEFAFPTQTLHVRQEAGEPPAHAVSTPPGATEALVLGRREAARIVADTLGRDASIPPPVDFGAVPDDDTPLRDAKVGGNDDT